MHLVSASVVSAERLPAPVALGGAPVGFAGRSRQVRAPAATGGLSEAELERRLIELGFVEGALVEVLHQGPFGRDPIAVRVDEATVALRRRDAAGILVEPVADDGALAVAAE
jgi:ferrous iron transport protein A